MCAFQQWKCNWWSFPHPWTTWAYREQKQLVEIALYFLPINSACFESQFSYVLDIYYIKTANLLQAKQLIWVNNISFCSLCSIACIRQLSGTIKEKTTPFLVFFGHRNAHFMAFLEHFLQFPADRAFGQNEEFFRRKSQREHQKASKNTKKPARTSEGKRIGSEKFFMPRTFVIIYVLISIRNFFFWDWRCLILQIFLYWSENINMYMFRHWFKSLCTNYNQTFAITHDFISF